jgi:hypothetical protein
VGRVWEVVVTRATAWAGAMRPHTGKREEG